MRRQIGRAIEDFVAFRATVLDVDDARTAMLGQTEGVFEDDAAEATQVVADAIVDLGQLGPRFFRHLHNVESRIDVSRTDHQSVFSHGWHVGRVSDDCARDGRNQLVIESQPTDRWGCFLAAAASSLFSCQLLLLFRFSCSMQLNRRKRLSPLVASSSFVCLLKAFSFFVFVVFFSL